MSTPQVALAPNLQPQKVLDTVAFWSDDNEADLKLNPVKPKIVDLDLAFEIKIEFAASCLIENIVIPWLKAGREKDTNLRSLASMVAATRSQYQAKGYPNEKEHRIAKFMFGLFDAISIVADPSPMAALGCTNISIVRKVINGEDDVPPPFDILADIIDEEKDVWSKRKVAWSGHRTWDLENGPKIQKCIAKLTQHGSEIGCVEEVTSDFGKYAGGCRKGGIVDLEDKIFECCKAIFQAAAGDGLPDSGPDFPTTQRLADCLQAAAQYMYKGDCEKHEELASFIDKVTKKKDELAKSSQALSLLGAIEQFGNQNTWENFLLMVSEVQRNEGIVFKGDDHKKAIDEAIQALVRSCKAQFEEYGQCVDLDKWMSSMKEKFLAGVALTRKWHENGDWAGFQAWCQEGAAFLNVKECAMEFARLGQNRHERFESTEAHDRYSKLRAVAGELQDAPWMKHAKGSGTEPAAEWLALRSSLLPMKEEAGRLMQEHLEDTVDDIASTLQDDLKNAQEIQGGLPDGASWRAGLGEDANWEAIKKAAEATVLGKPGRGMPKRLKEARAKLAKEIVAAKAMIEKVTDSMPSKVQELIASCNESLAKSDLTIVECKLLQELIRESQPIQERRSAVQNELDHVQDSDSLASDMLPPALYSQALKFMAG